MAFLTTVIFCLGMLDDGSAQKNLDLMSAAKSGASSKIETLLAQGADINTVDEVTGYVPLHWAVVMGNLEMVKLLCARGAKTSAVDHQGNMPFHLAAQLGKLDLVTFFLDQGISVTTPNALGDTASILAAEKGKTAMLRALLSRGADINERGMDKRTPLMAAVLSGKKKLIREMIKKGADPNMVNAFGMNAVMFARRADVIDALLRNGADIDPKTPGAPCLFTHEVKNGNLDLARWLMSRGADVHAKDPDRWNALMWARVGGHHELATRLEELGVVIPDQKEMKGASLAFHAAMGKTQDVKKDLGNGVSVDFKGPDGRTPLIFACEYSRHETALFLIDKGADVNAADQTGKTPLMAAVASQNVDLVAFLLGQKLEVNARNIRGQNALSIGKISGNIDDMIALLRDAGVEHIRNCNTCRKKP